MISGSSTNMQSGPRVMTMTMAVANGNDNPEGIPEYINILVSHGGSY